MQGREGLDWPLRLAAGSAFLRDRAGGSLAGDRPGHDDDLHGHAASHGPGRPPPQQRQDPAQLSRHDTHDHSAYGPGQSPAEGLAHDPAALISARGLALTRAGRPILTGVDIDIGPGEIVTVIGPNGAGKTMLVRALLGLEPLDRGAVRRRGGLVIGYAPQRFDIDRAIPLTVARFMALGRPAASRDQIARVLADVGAGPLVERQLSELSGGELQRVVLARALIRSPDLLVLDEPARAVDYAGEAELYTLIGRLRTEQGFGVLLVSHDLHVVMAQSDRVICLNRHVCCSGVPRSVAQHPEYARLFGPQAAQAFGVYRHEHDHSHDLAGAPCPGQIAGRGSGVEGRGDAEANDARRPTPDTR